MQLAFFFTFTEVDIELPNVEQAFFGHALKNSSWKKLKLMLKKLKTQEFFAKNSKFWQIIYKIKKIFNQI